MNPQQQHEYDVAVQQGHQLFLDNYPIDSQYVLDIYNAVKKKNPALVVTGGSRQGRKICGNSSEHYAVYRGLDLAYANLPDQIVGTIGYEYDQFFVTSRLIENAKYSQWSGRDYNTKKSKHMNNIVKEALKALLPTQFKEVISESDGKFHQNIREIRDKAVYNMRSNLNGTHNVLRDELFHMVATGYVPKNPQVKRAMEYVVESKDEYERNESYDPPKTFVWIKPDSVMYGKDDKDMKEVRSIDELSEDIRGKLFVLMVADKGTFIDAVGMKADDNKFWVIL